MRINKYVAQATGLSRRAADAALLEGHILVNGLRPAAGQDVGPQDHVTLQGRTLTLPEKPLTILLNKPVGFVVSREGQGSKTIYDLLPPEYHHLKPIGRLDKDSSGLLLLTSDGQLAQELTHPKYQKYKVYEVTLNKPLSPQDKQKIEQGVTVEDYTSRLQLSHIGTNSNSWQITMAQGKNRQIRRTFDVLGYKVVQLHRTQFDHFTLGTLAKGAFKPFLD